MAENPKQNESKGFDFLSIYQQVQNIHGRNTHDADNGIWRQLTL